jgi:hypothetical protein
MEDSAKLHSQSHMLPKVNLMHTRFDLAPLCRSKEVKRQNGLAQSEYSSRNMYIVNYVS